ncbi:MAG: hypothetical protein ABI183_03070 [Polyangiaceae bacterium]
MTTLRDKLFGIGKLPDDMRAAAEAEGTLHSYEGVPVAYEFSGQLPGLSVKGTNTRSYSGAIALTKKRVLGPCWQVRWTKHPTLRARCSPLV